MAVFGIVGILSTASMAFAQATSTVANAPTTTVAPMKPTQLPVLNVGAAGKVLLRGTIKAVTSSSITVTSWGGDWTVNVSASAQVMPQGVALSSFQVGDFVGVQGTVNQSSSWTVDASLVRDWTARAALSQEIKTNVQAAHATMSGAAHVTEGTLSGLDATTQTFTLTTPAGTAYTVTLSSGAEIIGKNWATIKLAQANSGDMVRVFGTVSGTVITGSVFRDVTVK